MDSKRIVQLLILLLLLAAAYLLGRSGAGPPPAPMAVMPPLAFTAADVRAESLTGTIQLQNGAPPVVNLQARLSSNRLLRIVGVRFRGATAPANQDSLDRKIRIYSPPPLLTYSGLADRTQTVTVGLLLEVEDLPLGTSVGSVDISVLPPSNVRGLVRSVPPLVREESGGQIRYVLRDRQRYLTDLFMIYACGVPTIEVIREAREIGPPANRQVQVRLDLRNLGPGEATPVTIRADHAPHEFSGEDARDGSFTILGSASDRRIEWSRDLGPIPENGTVTTGYVLRIVGNVRTLFLDPVRIYVNGQLAGASDRTPVLRRP